jgi:hypothetical protein
MVWQENLVVKDAYLNSLLQLGRNIQYCYNVRQIKGMLTFLKAEGKHRRG